MKFVDQLDRLWLLLPHVKCNGGVPDILEAAADEINRLRTSVREWQPIETAPSNQQIIGWEPSYGFLLVAHRTITGKWHIKSSGNYWSELPNSVKLTLWQPVPKPPDDAP